MASPVTAPSACGSLSKTLCAKRARFLELCLAKRLPALERVVTRCTASKAARTECAQRDIYQFGVFVGVSMQAVSAYLRDKGVPYRALIGFDSFRGLPSEERGAAEAKLAARHPAARKYRMRVDRGDFRAGQYSTSTAFGEAAAGSNGLLSRRAFSDLEGLINDTRVIWVAGFYNESLTPSLATAMRPALYVDGDADLYSSTYQSLNWMLRHSLLERGSVLFYDDWRSGASVGQDRAHIELATACDMRTEELDARGSTGKMFAVKAVTPMCAAGDQSEKSAAAASTTERPLPRRAQHRLFHNIGSTPKTAHFHNIGRAGTVG